MQLYGISMVSFAHTLESFFCLPVHWHLCGLALLALLFFLDRKSKRGGFFAIFIWNLIGVSLHELAHLLVGILLFAKPSAFSLIPHQQKDGVRLGSVSFRGLNAFNSLPVGLAPLGLIVVDIYVIQNWPGWFTPTLYSTLGIYFASFVMIYNALPSWQDLKIAFGWKSILLYGAAAIAAYEYIWQVR
jgi:hypothetical protein